MKNVTEIERKIISAQKELAELAARRSAIKLHVGLSLKK